MNSNELDSLCQEMLDGTISVEHMVLLEGELLQNPHSLQEYIKHAAVQNSLEILHEPIVITGERSVIPMDRVILRQKRRTLQYVALATAALLLISVTILSIISSDDGRPQLTYRLASGTEYVVSHPKGTEEKVEGGELVKGSSLSVSQGTIELTFKSGVKSILQAPAMITLVSEDTLQMEEGTAWYRVPSGAKGFTVYSEALKVVDLGTEFGVIADSNEVYEIHVLKGKVKASALINQRESAVVSTGQAMSVDEEGRLVSIPVKEARFLDKMPRSLNYMHWSFDELVDDTFLSVNSVAPLRSDAGPVAYAGNNRMKTSDMQIEGRYGKAVQIDSKVRKYLMTNYEGIGGDRPRTVAFWCRVNEVPRRDTGLALWGRRDHFSGKSRPSFRDVQRWLINIVPSEGASKNSIPGCIQLIGTGYLSGKTNICDAQWHHIALTYKFNLDGSPNICVFIDGKREEMSSNYEQSLPQTVVQGVDANALPVCLGYRNNGISSGASLKADIDELYIFEGALTEKSVRRLMENQSP